MTEPLSPHAEHSVHGEHPAEGGQCVFAPASVGLRCIRQGNVTTLGQTGRG